MQGFLHIYKINKNYKVKENIEFLIKEYKTKEIYTYRKTNENIISIYFTNEFQKYPYYDNYEGLFTPVGVFAENIMKIKGDIIYSSDAKNINYVKHLVGQFALGYSDFTKNEVNLYTHIARVECLYSYVDDQVIVVGTDPLLISLITSESHVNFDINSMHSFILNGYYADNNTPFKNIKALPGNSFIKISNDKLYVTEIDDIYSNILNPDNDDNDYDKLTEIFMDSFNTQKDNNLYNLALTGGKDSRLIFAAMKANNFDMTLFTNGFEDNPDVIIAKKISEIYDIKHKTISPKISKENTISVNIYNKIKNVMLSTSGMVYGYENISLPGQFKGNKGFDGVGAELVKGGFAMFANSIHSDDKNILVNAFYKNNEFLLEDNINSYRNFLLEYIDNDYGLYESQLLYSMLYRTGRLTAAAKNATNYTKQTHSPFLDNKFLRNALKFSLLDNKNEEIHFQILKRIDERLINIPFAKDRWRKEKNKPLHKNDYCNWLKREPFFPNTVLGNYNWRQIQNNNKEVVEQFRNILLSNPYHVVYQIVDYAKIKKIFERKIIAKHMRLIWSIASIIIFVNELTEVSNKLFNKSIKIKLPSSSINNYKNKKKIIDITNNFTPLNKSIKLITPDNSIKLINEERHRKLQLFTGETNKAPSEIDIRTVSDLIIRINIDQSSKKQVIRGQIIYFKEGKRVKVLSLDSKLDENNTELLYRDKNLKNYDSFRILLNFNDAKLKDTFKINYAYYEITH